ncbi:hypothetical protein [uncultured Cellulomonas sp.]|uniref:hypothetical protein n=1 Tax=uncultured Cellulomonas sp. TaxID=189682 RepID=UPI0026372E0D|nr:hypothetical protein [uncultured Cellulomonas sp.]
MIDVVLRDDHEVARDGLSAEKTVTSSVSSLLATIRVQGRTRAALLSAEGRRVHATSGRAGSAGGGGP